MTAHDPALQWPEHAPTPHFAAANRLVRPLAWLAAVTVVAAASCFVLFGPWRPAGLVIRHSARRRRGHRRLSASRRPRSHRLLAMQLAPPRRFVANGNPVSLTSAAPQVRGCKPSSPCCSTAMAACAIIIDWPGHLRGRRATATSPPADFPVASALLLLATPWLLAERYFATLTPRTIARGRRPAGVALPAGVLPRRRSRAAGRRGARLRQAPLGARGPLDHPAADLAAEIVAARAGRSGSCRRPTARRACGDRQPPGAALRGRSLSPAAWRSVVRSQFGMDFSRSWALRFMRAAGAPGRAADAGVLLVSDRCHPHRPEPARLLRTFRGRRRRCCSRACTSCCPGRSASSAIVELGVIHSALISFDDQGATADGPDRRPPRATAPASANRLWDLEQPSDVVLHHRQRASRTARASRPSAPASACCSASASSDDAGRAALYREADPDALVHSLASRMLAQFFAAADPAERAGRQSGGDRAASCRTRLQQALDRIGQRHRRRCGCHRGDPSAQRRRVGLSQCSGR